MFTYLALTAYYVKCIDKPLSIKESFLFMFITQVLVTLQCGGKADRGQALRQCHVAAISISRCFWKADNTVDGEARSS